MTFWSKEVGEETTGLGGALSTREPLSRNLFVHEVADRVDSVGEVTS